MKAIAVILALIGAWVVGDYLLSLSVGWKLTIVAIVLGLFGLQSRRENKEWEEHFAERDRRLREEYDTRQRARGVEAAAPDDGQS
jgi:hypothetical protein